MSSGSAAQQAPGSGRYTMSKLVPRDRLQKLCGLFGSQHDGERAAAAALADKLVRSAGLTWRDVIRWPEPAHSPPEMADIPDDWRDLATRALRHRDQLSAWELDFLHTVTGRRHVSEKQWRVIQRLARRTGEM
jgi:hypothetical protein